MTRYRDLVSYHNCPHQYDLWNTCKENPIFYKRSQVFKAALKAYHSRSGLERPLDQAKAVVDMACPPSKREHKQGIYRQLEDWLEKYDQVVSQREHTLVAEERRLRRLVGGDTITLTLPVTESLPDGGKAGWLLLSNKAVPDPDEWRMQFVGQLVMSIAATALPETNRLVVYYLNSGALHSFDLRAFHTSADFEERLFGTIHNFLSDVWFPRNPGPACRNCYHFGRTCRPFNMPRAS